MRLFMSGWPLSGSLPLCIDPVFKMWVTFRLSYRNRRFNNVLLEALLARLRAKQSDIQGIMMMIRQVERRVEMIPRTLRSTYVHIGYPILFKLGT